MKLDKISDRELCRRVDEQGTVTDFERELLTRLLERNAGAKEIADKKDLETKVVDPAMIPIDRAIFITFCFLLAQAFIFLYIIPSI